MHQQKPEQTGGATSAKPRADWTRPEINRFIAGGAESAGGPSFDGADLPS